MPVREREREGERRREVGSVCECKRKNTFPSGLTVSFTPAWLSHWLSKLSVSLHWLYEFFPYLFS